MKSIALVLVLAFVLAGVAAAVSTTATLPSLTVNTSSDLRFGGTVSFTGVYPQTARQKVGQQQPWNPVVQLNCSQSGTMVFQQSNVIMADERNNHDGTWTGVTYPVTLSANSGFGIVWPGGAADCSASLYYWSKDPHTGALILNFVAGTNFSVAAAG